MMLVRICAWVVAFLTNAALLGALHLAPFVDRTLRPEALPRTFVVRTIGQYPWPISGDIAPLIIGQSEREVQALFRDPYTLPPSQGRQRCLRFADAWKYPRVTVLFRGGRAEAIWIEPESAPSSSCGVVINREIPYSFP